MDWLRVTLIAGIGIVLYLLLLRWSELPPEETVREMTQPPPAQTEPSAFVPTIAPAVQSPPTSAAEDFVEQLTDDTQGEQPLGATGSSFTRNLEPVEPIRIRSDTLYMEINPRGGEIIRADLLKHALTLEEPEVPLPLLEYNGNRVYTVRGDLTGERGEPPRQYRAAQREYRMAPGADELVVRLHSEDEGVQVTKVFHLTRGAHLLRINFEVDNASNEVMRTRQYGIIRRDRSPDPGADLGIFGVQAYLGAAIYTPDKPYQKVDFEEIAEKGFRERIHGGWVAMLQHYFIGALIPEQGANHDYQLRRRDVDGDTFYELGFVDPILEIAPGERAVTGHGLYLGPKEQSVLAEISPGLDLTVDYGILWFLSQPLFAVLKWFNSLTGNWGWSIVLLTILIKLAFYWVSDKGYRSMAAMRKVAPKIKALQAQHAGDRQKVGQATMELYRKEGVNPFGGCLPMLIPMPVFIALYWVLLESVELRHAEFILWIHDLSQKDPYFILPLLMGASMFITQRMTPESPGMDPLQAKMMKFFPLLFCVLFLWFPAGLVLYWLVNNVLSVAQQWWVNHRIDRAT